MSAVDWWGGAGLSAAGHRRPKGLLGRARTRLGAQGAAGEGARPAERSGPTWAKPEAKGQGWTRTGLRDQVCRPLGLTLDKTSKGSLGNESPDEGTGRLGSSLKPRVEVRGLPQGSMVQPLLHPRRALSSDLPLPSLGVSSAGGGSGSRQGGNWWGGWARTTRLDGSSEIGPRHLDFWTEGLGKVDTLFFSTALG